MPVTVIDIALEPDATMIQHAKADNARLLKEFPKGFALDATHHPHVSVLQQFVRTADLDKVYAAADAVLAKEKHWKPRHSNITTFRTRPSVLLALLPNRQTTCFGYNEKSLR